MDIATATIFSGALPQSDVECRRETCKSHYNREGMNGVNNLTTKGEIILPTTDKTRKQKLPTSDKKLTETYRQQTMWTPHPPKPPSADPQ